MPRSLTLTAIALVQGFISVMSLVSGICLVLLMTGAAQLFSRDLTGLSLPLKGLIVLGLAISLLGLVVTVGLWRRQRWGWVGSLIFQSLCIANNGLALLAGQSMTLGVGVAIAVCLTLIVVLCLPTIRAAFTPESTEMDAAITG